MAVLVCKRNIGKVRQRPFTWAQVQEGDEKIRLRDAKENELKQRKWGGQFWWNRKENSTKRNKKNSSSNENFTSSNLTIDQC